MCVGPNNLSKEQRTNKNTMMVMHGINICANQSTLKWRGMIKVDGSWEKVTEVDKDFNVVHQYCLDYLKERVS